MLNSDDNTIVPINQDITAEPPEWEIYRALALHRAEYPAATSNPTYQNKLSAAYFAYLNTFVGG